MRVWALVLTPAPVVCLAVSRISSAVAVIPPVSAVVAWAGPSCVARTERRVDQRSAAVSLRPGMESAQAFPHLLRLAVGGPAPCPPCTPPGLEDRVWVVICSATCVCCLARTPGAPLLPCCCCWPRSLLAGRPHRTLETLELKRTMGADPRRRSSAYRSRGGLSHRRLCWICRSARSCWNLKWPVGVEQGDIVRHGQRNWLFPRVTLDAPTRLLPGRTQQQCTAMREGSRRVSRSSRRATVSRDTPSDRWPSRSIPS